MLWYQRDVTIVVIAQLALTLRRTQHIVVLDQGQSDNGYLLTIAEGKLTGDRARSFRPGIASPIFDTRGQNILAGLPGPIAGGKKHFSDFYCKSHKDLIYLAIISWFSYRAYECKGGRPSLPPRVPASVPLEISRTFNIGVVHDSRSGCPFESLVFFMSMVLKSFYIRN